MCELVNKLAQITCPLYAVASRDGDHSQPVPNLGMDRGKTRANTSGNQTTLTARAALSGTPGFSEI
ncbi:hypothetical protein NBRC116589_04960 [Ruegeria sp. HU-ET01832]